MNSVSASTGYTPFQLHLGRSLRVIPPIVDTAICRASDYYGLSTADTAELLKRLDTDFLETQNNLRLAKIEQALQVNKHCGPERIYKVGDQVLLFTLHRRREYMIRSDNRVAKSMVRYDGPYLVVEAQPDCSVYTLGLPASTRIHPTFHASLLKLFIPNDATLFPSRDPACPAPVVTENGQEEWLVERLLDRRWCGRGWQ